MEMVCLILAPILLVSSRPSLGFDVLTSFIFIENVLKIILIYACSVGFDRHVYNTREIIIVP